MIQKLYGALTAVLSAFLFIQADCGPTYGSLSVSTVLHDESDSFSGKVTIHYQCSDGKSGDFTLAGNASSLFVSVQDGTTCTITEPNPPSVDNYLTSVTFSPIDPKSASDSVVTIAQGTATKVTITNNITAETGSLVLANVLVDGGSGFTQSVTAHYDCGSGATGDVTIAPNTSAEPIFITFGSTCIVTQPTLPSASGFVTTASFNPTGGMVDISANTTSTVTVTDTMAAAGTLEFDITLTDNSSAGYNGNGQYIVTYFCNPGVMINANVTVNNGFGMIQIPVAAGFGCNIASVTPPSDAIAPATFSAPSFPKGVVLITAGMTSKVSITDIYTDTSGILDLNVAPINFDGSPFNGVFVLNYNCSDGSTGYKFLTASALVTEITIDATTTRTCTVTPGHLPNPLPQTFFGTPTFTPPDPKNIADSNVQVAAGSPGQTTMSIALYPTTSGVLSVGATLVDNTPGHIFSANQQLNYSVACSDNAGTSVALTSFSLVAGQMEDFEIPGIAAFVAPVTCSVTPSTAAITGVTETWSGFDSSFPVTAGSVTPAPGVLTAN